MKIASWNINGIKARHDVLIAWLKEARPDIACLQEIKSVDENFPASEIEALGYTVTLHGQKGFNGVAILSRMQPEEVERGLPGDEDDVQARFLSALFIIEGSALRINCLYLPNGNPVDDPRKFDYKLAWMDRLYAHAKASLLLEEPTIYIGDYNVIPQDEDCWDPKIWEGDALTRPESRARFEAMKNLGYTEALRACDDSAGLYTFWDYQAGAWPKNHGIRIDHFLMSPDAADQLRGVSVDTYVRGWEKPSDHVPVWIDYNPKIPSYSMGPEETGAN